MPKIQRLVTPITLQRKRRRIALKNKRRQKRREESAIYHQTLTKYAKVNFLIFAKYVRKKIVDKTFWLFFRLSRVVFVYNFIVKKHMCSLPFNILLRSKRKSFLFLLL